MDILKEKKEKIPLGCIKTVLYQTDLVLVRVDEQTYEILLTYVKEKKILMKKFINGQFPEFGQYLLLDFFQFR